jgi:pilus retraction protein PilT
MSPLLPYLRLAVERRASDLYLSAGAPAMLRVDGSLAPVGGTALDADAVRRLIDTLLNDEQRRRLHAEHEIDLAGSAEGCGRFRVNVFRQRGSLAMVLRLVPDEVPTLAALGAPPVLAELAMLRRGLVIVAGPTGCGKSTTLAAMIRQRNAHAAGHILSIEDPIEFLHPNLRSIVNQREVGIDTESYDRALVSALREAPDVVYLGEVRRRETLAALLQIANTGHLALSTLHANNASQALARMINLFPQDQRDPAYLDLALTLRAVVSQRLVAGVDGRRRAVVEVLVNTPYVAELLAARRLEEIPAVLAQSSEGGMRSFDRGLAELVEQGQITQDEALAHADSAANLAARMAFGNA